MSIVCGLRAEFYSLETVDLEVYSVPLCLVCRLRAEFYSLETVCTLRGVFCSFVSSL